MRSLDTVGDLAVARQAGLVEHGAVADPREAEVRRLFARYHREVVDAWQLCPWSADAEPAIFVAWGEPSAADLGEIAQRFADTDGAIAIILAPETRADPTAWRWVRDAVGTAEPRLALADFHPAGGDPTAASAARLPMLLRRSPDPLLQLVPQTSLASLTRRREWVTPEETAQILAGTYSPPRDPREVIAQRNAERVAARGLDALLAILADLAADRTAAYARVGINAQTW